MFESFSLWSLSLREKAEANLLNLDPLSRLVLLGAENDPAGLKVEFGVVDVT